MTDKCNPLRCTHYSAGWCEYDIATGKIYPNNAGGCPLEEDNRMTINEYQQAAARTAPGKARAWSNVGLGLAGEAGEVADIIKKYLHQGHPLEVDKLIEELGDIAWYLALGATVAGVPLEEILQRNIDKLMGRYPQGFDPERSLHREAEA